MGSPARPGRPSAGLARRRGALWLRQAGAAGEGGGRAGQGPGGAPVGGAPASSRPARSSFEPRLPPGCWTSGTFGAAVQLYSGLPVYTVTQHSVMVSARGCPGSTCISPVWLDRCKLSLSLSLLSSRVSLGLSSPASALCAWKGAG